MKKFSFFLALLFAIVSLVSLVAFISFYFNIETGGLGDVIGSAMLLPIAMVVQLVSAALSLLFSFFAMGCESRIIKRISILNIIVLLMECGYVIYTMLVLGS